MSHPDPIATLMAEHRLIERALASLRRWAHALAPGDAPPTTAAILDFITGFSDVHHHYKEEDLLFAAMAARGFPTHAGPIAVMLHEHKLFRAHTRALRELCSHPLTRNSIGAIVDHAERFASSLEAHIQKEDRILYPLARDLLEHTMADLAALCDQHDEAHRAKTDALLAALTPLLDPAP
jgi:hemerythrin-like domain-containing protein